MHFNRHFHLAGKHAFLSASKPHWSNYSEEKLETYFDNAMMAALGTQLHEFAKMAIMLRIWQKRSRKTLNRYINDCIGYGMVPEQILYYSDNCFGTSDAIDFVEDQMLLRIFDLKTGATPGKMLQLLIYAALFCLEYDYKPHELTYDLRIYQHDDVYFYDGDENPADIIEAIMEKIVMFDKRIDEMREAMS